MPTDTDLLESFFAAKGGFGRMERCACGAVVFFQVSSPISGAIWEGFL
jgi:hypothetical protein